MTRWTLFLIVLILSVGLGLYYGWVVNPVKYQDTSIQDLRIDYQTDFTLMIAEAYQENQDLTWAMNRLTLLGDESPRVSVEEALKFAAQAEYTLPDMFLLRDLHNDLQGEQPSP